MDTDNVNKLEEYYIFICYNIMTVIITFYTIFMDVAFVIKAAEILLIS